MQDLNDNGIYKATPTSGIDGSPADSGSQVRSVYDGRTASYISLLFTPTTPYGKRYHYNNGQITQDDPYGANYPNAYNCAPVNPIFTGWQPIYNTIDAVLLAASNHGITIEEIDLQNESAFNDYTVYGRLIVDPKNEDRRPGDVSNVLNVLDSVRYYMSYRNFNQNRNRVTWSVNEDRTYPLYTPGTGQTPNQCSNDYGDPARLNTVSHLIAAIAGYPFSNALNSDNSTGLRCGGALDWSVILLASNTVPDVIDIHSKPCLLNVAFQCDPDQSAATLTMEAKAEYDALNSFFLSYGPGPGNWHGYNPQIWSALAMMGEAHSNVTNPKNPTQNCETDPSFSAAATVTGFNASALASRSTAGGTVFRPWSNPWFYDVCYPFPNPVNPY